MIRKPRKGRKHGMTFFPYALVIAFVLVTRILGILPVRVVSILGEALEKRM